VDDEVPGEARAVTRTCAASWTPPSRPRCGREGVPDATPDQLSVAWRLRELMASRGMFTVTSPS
jgi:hypothetical protein